MTVINVHAPTEEKEEELKEEFYEVSEDIVGKIPKTDCKEEIYRKITGGESKHNGFAIGQKMKIMSTYFKRKNIHKGTWIIPGRKETNQIDHVLIEEQEAGKIKNVRSYRGANADSDHFLVIAKLKLSKTEKKKELKER
ncbi:hypothetical protein RI129_003750 [Pyrocoelia pectoralis]|uniref:Uncharacterized protein n=1 Tax=Pyrocoelia pectoralis TaxID=417401 RepID=A0AAN7VR80_9COLE